VLSVDVRTWQDVGAHGAAVCHHLRHHRVHRQLLACRQAAGQAGGARQPGQSAGALLLHFRHPECARPALLGLTLPGQRQLRLPA
jgi:hypothetical protein